MNKVVINKCYGGFSLSDKAIMLYAELCGFDLLATTGQFSALTGPDFYLVSSQEELDAMTDDERNAAYFSYLSIDRDDVILVEVVERLGGEADGTFAELKIVEIPDDVEWTIEEYDGIEWIAEVHRTWS